VSRILRIWHQRIGKKGCLSTWTVEKAVLHGVITVFGAVQIESEICFSADIKFLQVG
jgi:hypothetical protein